MSLVHNMVGGGASFSAQINVTNAVPNTVVTATSGANVFTATADESGNASIIIKKTGTYTLTNSGRYSPSAISIQANVLVSARMLSVPIEYQEVTFLKSTGLQRIDTGLTGSIINELEFKIKLGESNPHIIAYTDGTGANTFRLSVDVQKLFMRIADASATGTTLLNQTDIYNIRYVKGDGFYLNGNKEGNITKISSSTKNLPIFASQDYATGYHYSQLEMYRGIINTTNGNHEYIPVYRKADNVAGMFDRIAESFLTNAGSGTFVVGGNVT